MTKSLKGRFIQNWKYLKYIIKHKFYVYTECRKLGLSFYRAIIHDWQKFLSVEWIPYLKMFYGDEHDKNEVIASDSFNYAWLHHIHYGPHHWQYWILINDDGTIHELEMPIDYRKEMIADWRGASLAIRGYDDTSSWYSERKDVIRLAPETRCWVEKELRINDN